MEFNTIRFGNLSAAVIDLVDGEEGLRFLRMVGVETVLNAIWARLSTYGRGSKRWQSDVLLPYPGRALPIHLGLAENVEYRVHRTRLPASQMIDMAIIHPILTITGDTRDGFYLLTYDEGVPRGFFNRLNRSLSIPLDPAWEEWLWELGRQPQTWQREDVHSLVEEGHQRRTVYEVVTRTETPIERLESFGTVACYRVNCAGTYHEAWQHLIWQHLGLGLQLQQAEHGDVYQNGPWVAKLNEDGQWVLYQDKEVVVTGFSLPHLLIRGREQIGYPIRVGPGGKP